MKHLYKGTSHSSYTEVGLQSLKELHGATIQRGLHKASGVS